MKNNIKNNNTNISVSDTKLPKTKTNISIDELMSLYHEYKDDIFSNDIILAKKRLELLHRAYRSLSFADKLRILADVFNSGKLENDPDIANTIALINIKKYTIYTVEVLIIISLVTLSFYVIHSDDITTNWLVSTGLAYIKIIFGI